MSTMKKYVSYVLIVPFAPCVILDVMNICFISNLTPNFIRSKINRFDNKVRNSFDNYVACLKKKGFFLNSVN